MNLRSQTAHHITDLAIEMANPILLSASQACSRPQQSHGVKVGIVLSRSNALWVTGKSESGSNKLQEKQPLNGVPVSEISQAQKGLLFIVVSLVVYEAQLHRSHFLTKEFSAEISMTNCINS